MTVARGVARTVGAAMLAVPLALAFAPTATASASTPQRIVFSEDFPPTPVNDICSFPVTVSGHRDAVANVLDSHNVIHYTEQDVLSANGHTLTSLPFTYNTYASTTRLVSSGVVAKIPLENGHLFLAAGRVDFSLPHGDFILTADFGNQTPDIGELCAELSA
jgi:hypothetical protein